MKREKQLKQYARLLICQGINLYPGQMLVISIPAEHYMFARLLQEEAYRAGAGRVKIEFSNHIAARNDYLYGDEASLSHVRPSELLRRKEAQEEHAAFLSIISDHPGSLKGVDEEKAGRIRRARSKALRSVQEYTLKSQGQWCAAAMPNTDWAKKVFPDIRDDEQALDALYDAIFHTVCLDKSGSAIKNWQKHGDEIRRHCDMMNAFQFAALHFKNGIGTDLLVPLPANHIWGGGRETASLTGQGFDPNIPTEEIFTAPHRLKTEGTVTASRPLCVDGQIIDQFSFTFRKGKVTDWKAKKGKKTLEGLLKSDSGSVRLGEVALVPYDSNISNLNLLFYETLFDENAACHLALGAAYPTSVAGGEQFDDAQLRKAGLNTSMIHVDFMFGTEDLTVTGIAKDGSKTAVFRGGNFVF